MFSAGASQGSQGAADALLIEDIYAAVPYVGNGGTQVINTGVNLAAGKGFAWIKGRSAATGYSLCDTLTGVQKDAGLDVAQSTQATGLTAFGASSITIGSLAKINTNGATYEARVFRAVPGAIDVVTWTGDGVSGRKIPHSLGAVPGAILIKPMSSVANWACYHRSQNSGTNPWLFATQFNNSAGGEAGSALFGSTAPTDVEFTVNASTQVNAAGAIYVAYIFAHDITAGGMVQCGGYTGNGLAAGPVIDLGWEPAALMIRRLDAPGTTREFSAARGMTVGGADAYLSFNNTAAAEVSADHITPQATGFSLASADANVNASAGRYAYIAIRRGPMRVPTDSAKVFMPKLRTGTGAAGAVSGGPLTDIVISKQRNGTGIWAITDRLRGAGITLSTSTAVETATANDVTGFDVADGFRFGTGAAGNINTSGGAYIDYLIRRWPGVVDHVIYKGKGGVLTVEPHNLGVVPEMMWLKRRDTAAVQWFVYHKDIGASLFVSIGSTAAAAASSSLWNGAPTATGVPLTNSTNVNSVSSFFTILLFATCTGISKVGSYTGTGAVQDIDCGFSGGARFVLIKRTDAVGQWIVLDTARGIVAGNDTALLLNSTSAESSLTPDDYLNPRAGGFSLTASATINTVGGNYIFLAFA